MAKAKKKEVNQAENTKPASNADDRKTYAFL
jgi:hypothetical protein